MQVINNILAFGSLSICMPALDLSYCRDDVMECKAEWAKAHFAACDAPHHCHGRLLRPSHSSVTPFTRRPRFWPFLEIVVCPDLGVDFRSQPAQERECINA